jgi:hypothetical protein
METSRTPEAAGPEAPSPAPAPPAPAPRRDEPDVPLPAWVTDAVGAAPPPTTPAPEPRPTGSSDEPDGDTTIERAVVRGYLPPTRPAPHPGGPAAPPPVEPRRRSRALPVLAAVVGVAALAAAAFVLIPRDDDADPGPGPVPQSTTSTSLVVPTGLTAVESAAGVQLDWEGPESDSYAVLMLSEIAAPRVLPVDAGTSMLVPTTSLVPDDAYCFAVAYVAGLEAAPSSEDAFSPPVCIRGASEDTVRPD